MDRRTVQLNLPKTDSVDIEFINISYTVSTGFFKQKKTILKGVDGCFKSNQFTAIMGPSGAGKSSLLNILTGMERNGVNGTFKFSSSQGTSSWSQFRRELCYIQQDDMLYPLFTVHEIMNMATELKIGNSLSRKAKQMLIDDVLDTLELMKTKETRCDRLSGGQRKRLSIALELVDNPPVMFLDEPTTGLDSLSSFQCLSMLQNLARHGRTIVCTIHQPSATIYELFDQIYFLAEGLCVYQGHPKNTVNYLNKIGICCPKYHNPADFMVEVICKEYGNFSDRLVEAAKDFSWKAVHPETKSSKILYHTNSTLKYSTEGKTKVLIAPPSELSRFCVLLKRSCILLFRDWTVTHLKLALHILVGIILGLMYVNSGSDGRKSINNLGFLTINAVYICYTSIMPAVLKFPSEMPILRKERLNNWYKLRTYYAAFIISNLPVHIVFICCFSLISYFLSSQPFDASRYFMFVLTLILVGFVAEGFGLVLGTLLDPINGTFLAAIATCTCLLFCGFLVLFNHMSRIMYYITYTSYLRYAFEALVVSVYGFNRGNLECPSGETLTYCHYRMPKTILIEMDMLDVNYWENIAILAGYFVVLRLIVYFTLKRKLSMVE